MKKVKGIAAFASAVIVLNSTSVVWAVTPGGTGNTNGSGTFEGNVSEPDSVCDVVLPTVPEDLTNGDSRLNFYLDPNDLIKRTDGLAHSGKSFDPGDDTSHSNYIGTKGLYFANSGKYYDYSGKSDVFTAKNVGTTQIDISVKATLSDYDGISLKDATVNGFDWVNINDAGLYLAITKEVETNPAPSPMSVVNDEASAKLEERLDATDGTLGNLTWDSTLGYHYEAGTPGTPVEYNFYVEGQAGGDWSDINDDFSPTLNLTWTLKEVKEDIEPRIMVTTEPLALSSDTTNGAPTTVSVDLGSGRCEATGITSITFYSDQRPGYANINIMAADKVTFDASTKKISFAPEYVATLVGDYVTAGTVTVTFNNDKVKGTGDEPVDGSTTISFDVTLS